MLYYKGEKRFEAIIMSILIFICLIISLPLIHVLASSFSNPEDVFLGRVFLIPVNFSVESFKRVFAFNDIWTGYLNSIYYATLSTVVKIFVAFTAAFAFTNKKLPLRKLFFRLMLITMFFGGGLIPTYLLVTGMGLGNTAWALVLPGAVGVWNVLVIRTYISNAIPEEIKESAVIDGITPFGMLFKIIIPLSKPIVVIIALYSIIGSWNSYFEPMIYITSESKFNLQLVLRNIIFLNDIGELGSGESFLEKQKILSSLKYVSIVVATAPILIVYPFFSKYFEKGVMVGSLKG